MNITRFSIKRPIGICMIYILICVLGLISFFRIGVELLPDVDSKFISVIVNYPGASTESVAFQAGTLSDASRTCRDFCGAGQSG